MTYRERNPMNKQCQHKKLKKILQNGESCDCCTHGQHLVSCVVCPECDQYVPAEVWTDWFADSWWEKIYLPCVEKAREWMSMVRKLKKNVAKQEESKLPAILIVPSDTFDPSGADLITVTDQEIYEKVLDGAKWALDNNRQGVTRAPNNVPGSNPRIIIGGGNIK